jgi:hypothetical protein
MDGRDMMGQAKMADSFQIVLWPVEDLLEHPDPEKGESV